MAEVAGASGLAFVRKGFAFDAEMDRWFALGWPHVRLLVEDEVDDEAAVEYVRRLLVPLDPTPRLRWRRRDALAYVRALGGASILDLSPNERTVRDDVVEAMWNPSAYTVAELRAALQNRLTTSPLGLGERAIENWALLAEALLGAGVVAEAIVSALEGMDADHLLAKWSGPSFVTFQLGYMLLRIPKVEADRLRARLHDLLARVGVDPSQPRSALDSGYSHLRSIWLVLGGAKAAGRGMDKNLHWCLHATDDANFVRMRVATDKLGHRPDGRLVFLGGHEVLKHYGKRWQKAGGDEQRWFFEQIAPIQSEHTAQIALEMATDSALRPEARRWFFEHPAFGAPFLEQAVSREGAWTQRAREILGELR